jgi:RNA polymerase sigma factor (sigma-70 family)
MSIEEAIEQYDNMILALATSLYSPNRMYSVDDLAQEGRMSMVKHVDKHNPDRGKLSTFITICAKNDMLKFINKYTKHLKNHEQIRPSHSYNIMYSPDIEVRDARISSNEDVVQMIDLKMAGYSDTYIAKTLKTNLQNTKYRIKKALSK